MAKEQGFTGFARTFFSELEGNDIMKKAPSCALFSTAEELFQTLFTAETCKAIRLLPFYRP